MRLWQALGYISVVLCALMIYITKVLEFPIGYFSGVLGVLVSLFTTLFLVWPSRLTSFIPLAEEGASQILFFLLYLLYSFGFGAVLGLLFTKLYHELRQSTVCAARLKRITQTTHHFCSKKKRGR